MTAALRTLARLVVLAGLSAALVGCGSGLGDLEAWVAERKARKSRQIDPIPQMKPYEAFAYDGDGRRDPFLPTPGSDLPADPGSTSGIRPDLNRNREPLEEFPLDALRLVGIVAFNGRSYAMVRAPDAVVHRVAVGDHIGQNHGRISKVSEAEVRLTEIIPDGFGGYMERQATLAASE